MLPFAVYFEKFKTVQAAAIRFDDGKIYSASCHAMALALAEEDGYSQEDLDECEGYGFIIGNRYYNRDEAYRLLKLNQGDTMEPERLDSLDVPQLVDKIAVERPHLAATLGK